MAIRFECSKCKTAYDVGEDMAGKMILCRECEHRGPVPGKAPAAAVPPPGKMAPKPPGVSKGGPSWPMIQIVLAGVALCLLVTAGVYYWNHPLPWELRSTPSNQDDGGGRPDRGKRGGRGAQGKGAPGGGAPQDKGRPGGQQAK
jgi:hypothetical protein